MATFDQVRAMVPSLNPADRRKLAMLLDRFQGSTSIKSVSRHESLDADWLFQGLLKELKRRGAPDFTMRKISFLRSIAPNYELASQEVRVYFEKKITNPSPTELSALGVILARALAAHIESWRNGPTVSMRSLLLNVGSAAEALDNSFPGYVAGGMLPMMIGRRAKG